MRDMFAKYDNCIDKKDYEMDIPFVEPTRILESDPTLSLVTDIKGNELGVCARYNTPFDLYFMLDGCVEDSSIEELVCNSIITLQVVDHLKNVVLTKSMSPVACYIGDDTLKISFTQSDVSEFKRETYYMQLSLNWPGGTYTLYTENNGFLSFK